MRKKKLMVGVLASLIMASTCAPNINYGWGEYQFLGIVEVDAAVEYGTHTENDVTYWYQKEEGNVTIYSVKLNKQQMQKVTVPSKINGADVVSIDARAFGTSSGNNCMYVSELVLPNTLQTIGDKALQGCTNMSIVTVPYSIAKVAGSAFGPNTKIEHLWLLKDSGERESISTGSQIKELIKDMHVTYLNIAEVKGFVTCNDKGAFTRYGILELLDSLTYSPLFTRIYQDYSSELVSTLLPTSYTSDIEKMQILYNYIVTHVRYGEMFSGSSSAELDPLNNIHQKAFGALFCNSGVCASKADALYYLGKAAGLEIRTINVPKHRLNVFSPAGSNKYYYVDPTQFKFCWGYSFPMNWYTELATDKYQAREEGKICDIAEGFYGKTILVRVIDNNNTSTKTSTFNVKISDEKNLSKVFCNYSTAKVYDYGSNPLTNILSNKDVELYMYDNKYYQLKIQDGDKDVLTMDYALNHGDDYTTYFYDKNNVRHSLRIQIIYDQNDSQTKKTKNNAYFKITIN